MSKNILAKDCETVVVKLEHRFVELQNVFGGDVGLAGRGRADERFQFRRQILGSHANAQTENLINKYCAVDEMNGRFFHASPLTARVETHVRSRSTASEPHCARLPHPAASRWLRRCRRREAKSN